MTLADPPDTSLPPDYAALGATGVAIAALVGVAMHFRKWPIPAKDSIVRIDSRAWDPNWSERHTWQTLSPLFTSLYGYVRGMNLLTSLSSAWPG